MEKDRSAVREQAAVVLISTVASCVPALQPMLLGGLLAAHRIDPASLGYAATAEAVGVLLSTTMASSWFSPRRLRTIAMLAMLTVLLANLSTIAASPRAIVAIRGASGMGNGMLLWLLVNMLARARAPTRLLAIFVTANTSFVFILSIILTTYATPQFGPLAGYGLLALLYVLILPIIPFLPDNFAPLEGTDYDKKVPLTGMLALGAVMLHLTGSMAFWVYSIQLGSQSGIAVETMQTIVGAATGIQIVAGLSAIALASRLSAFQAVIGSVTLALISLGAMSIDGSIAIWLPAMVAFAFSWIFGPAFHIALLIAADPSRRAAVFLGTAQLGGGAAGPLVASLFVTTTDYAPARLVSVASLLGVLLLVVIVHFRRTTTQASLA